MLKANSENTAYQQSPNLITYVASHVDIFSVTCVAHRSVLPP